MPRMKNRLEKSTCINCGQIIYILPWNESICLECRKEWETKLARDLKILRKEGKR